MGTSLFIIIGFLFIITLVGTILIGKSESDKVKKYEQEGATASDELNRSLEYESSSLKKNIPSLLIIYTVVIIAGIITLAIYIF
ncbi:hypothetical protein [Tenuibacillus multivorans]|uniref:Uncharacterized protein n=1 Tax=Tenuibacillus multivorans TaxID=237069 RepID=A0A1H0G2R2_9BACI|nr:hypothetical protein [Tenuibacillus multivorans]GEL78104.1 hypothetical protein TMU01_23390 [Tenuibacillus multivorans]SDO01173.1 hypothetical protein SAMN05216498_0452 [Tenuibacillus multivorans]